MFKKVDTNMNFVEREREVEEFWKREDIFEKSIEEHKGDNSYVFYDGPPTANGKPHIGHVETRAFKDMIPRYHAMKGNMVPRKAGWDTHGLPVELEIEKEIGINGKEQIEAYGVAPFIDLCKKNVWKYKGMWEDFSYKVGFWADMENPYVTYHDDFIESEWWALKEIWKKKLLYKGFKVVPYCPRCGTPLSSHEVAQGYKDLTERSAVVRFKIKGEDGYFLAWTTTPWTLPSNVALCVHPDLVVIHFDAHTDLRDEYLGVKLSHASVIRRVWDLLGDDRIYQFGIRSGERAEWKWAQEGHTKLTPFDFTGLEAVLKKIEGKPVYFTIDLDVLDPAYFPGTGTPEAGGVTFLDLLGAARKVISCANVVACDLVELAPLLDASGVSTAVALKLLREMLLMQELPFLRPKK